MYAARHHTASTARQPYRVTGPGKRRRKRRRIFWRVILGCLALFIACLGWVMGATGG